jgi:transcription elongation GreA/GreB family factor
MTKETAVTCCSQYLNQKIERLQHEWKELSNGMQNDSKSTAGDKHETAQAMAQLEQEKLSHQLKELLDQKQSLISIEGKSSALHITNGSLVKTDKGFFFLCIPIGKIQAGRETLIGLSPKSPLGLQLLGLKAGNSAQVNNTTYKVLEIQ